VLAALDKIESYRKIGSESHFIAEQLALNKAHFLQLADRAGIDFATPSSAKLRAEHRPKLDDPVIVKLVDRSLRRMKERLDPTEAALKDLDLADLDDDDAMLPLPTSTSAAGGAKSASRTHKSANPFKSLHPIAASRKTKLG
jgi:hypothetical protein